MPQKKGIIRIRSRHLKVHPGPKKRYMSQKSLQYIILNLKKRPRTGSCSSALELSTSTPTTFFDVVKPCSDRLADKVKKIDDHKTIIALKSCIERLRGNSYDENQFDRDKKNSKFL